MQRNLWRILDEMRTKDYATYVARATQEKYKMSRYYPAYARQVHEMRFPEDDEDFSIDRHLKELARSMADGQPEESQADDEDEEIIMGRSTQSDRCPLTLMPMQEPYKSMVCNHRFERAAIIEHIQRHAHRQSNNGTVSCPVPGCPKRFRLQDLTLDQALLRRRRNLQQRQENRESAADRSEGEGNGDDEAATHGQADDDDEGDIV